MRQGRYSVTFDRDFDAVIAACAGRRQGRWHLTWITPRIMRVYARSLRRRSSRIPSRSGTRPANWSPAAMVSPIGAGFTAESQFTHEPNASRIGVTVLNWHLAHWGLPVQRRQADRAAVGEHGFPRHAAARISGAAGGGGAQARQERPLAGRNRPRHRVAIGSRDNSAVSYQPLFDHRVPTAGFSRSIGGCANGLARPVWPRQPGRTDSGIAAGGTG